MMRCDRCQSLLLDHLYGLLDPAEEAGVEEHLAGCPECASARNQAARAQSLFARAAKSNFPHVRFTPPVDDPRAAPADANGRQVAPIAPSIAAERKRFSRRVVWVQWAVAASVLALIPGVLLPLSKQSARYESAKRDADVAATQLADARAAVERAEGGANKQADERYAAAKRQHDELLAEWAAAEKAAAQAEKDRKVVVAVTRPEAAQPGAPNEFVVAIKDDGHTLAGRRVEAQVRDQTGKVLIAEKIDPKHAKGDKVRLPAGVWSHVTPQSELYLAVATVDEQTGIRADIQEPIRLFGPVYATMLVTDKASYRPGERLYFRSLTLDRVTFRPPAREQRLRYSLRKQDGRAFPDAVLTGTTGLVRVLDGTVEPVVDHDGRPVHGVGCGAFVLTADLADGDYTLTLTELDGPAGLPPVIKSPVTRTVRVRSGKPERFQKKIGFQAGSFAPGAEVSAWAEIKLGDKPVAGATAIVLITTDSPLPPTVSVAPEAKDPKDPSGKRKIPLTGITDEQGRVRITARLPANLPRGDVKLMVTFKADGAEESVAERVPISGKDVIVEFFPEGGNFVAGVPNRVYVRGTTPAGKPVDLRGVILGGKEEVARVETPTDANEPGVNRGLGAFTFTPRAGTAYRLKLQSSAFDLPPVRSEGVAMTVLDPVIGPGQPVRIRLYAVGKPRNLVVGAYTRGRLADTQTVAAEPGQPIEVKLLAGAGARGGVTRITVFEQPADPKADLIPVAERLVFRKPGEVLNLSVSAGAPGTAFAPGSPVDLSVAATDERWNPVPAILWAAAVNTAVAPGAKDRSLPTHFLLAGEIETPDDLEHADFLLTDHPKAAVALDHVLATQGWRRFVEQAGPAVVAKLPPGPRADSANRLLAMAGQRPLTSGSRGALVEKYWQRYEKAGGELEAAQRAKTVGDPALRQLLAVYEERRRETTDLTTAVRSAAEPLLAVRGWLGGAAGGLALFAVVLGVVTAVRWDGPRGALPLVVAAGGAGGLAVILALKASDRPSVPDVSAEFAQPAVAPAAPIPAPRFEKVQPVPPDSPDGANDGAFVKGPNAKREPGVPAALKGPNPLIVPLVAPKSPTPGIARPTMPDHLFSRGMIGLGGPVPDLTAIRVADRAVAEKAAAFADRRAAELSARIDAAFGPDKPAADPAARDRIRQVVLRTPPLVVREYAAPRPGSNDLAADGDTILWQPVIVLPTDGKAKLSFHLGTAPGGYQVIVAGHTPDGRLGTVRTVMPVAPAPPK